MYHNKTNVDVQQKIISSSSSSLKVVVCSSSFSMGENMLVKLLLDVNRLCFPYFYCLKHTHRL